MGALLVSLALVWVMLIGMWVVLFTHSKLWYVSFGGWVLVMSAWVVSFIHARRQL